MQTDNCIIITRIAIYVEMCKADIFLGIGLFKNNKTIKYVVQSLLSAAH